MLPLLILASLALGQDTSTPNNTETNSTQNDTSSFQYIAGYWESWNFARPLDYGSLLSSVPIVSNSSGYNMVLLAFSDFIINRDLQNRTEFSFINDQYNNGSKYDFDALKADIDVLSAQGAFVLVSVGGSSFSFKNSIKTTAQADKFVADLAEAMATLGLHGVDFSHVDASADFNMLGYIIEGLRALNDTSIIMYTMPAAGIKLEAFSGVLSLAINSIDLVQVTVYDYYWGGYDYQSDFEAMISAGVDSSKLMLGIMPGCHDAKSENTTVEDTVSYTNYAIENGMAGVAFWSINRDTANRTVLTDCLFQTGLPDGTFVDATFQALLDKTEPTTNGTGADNNTQENQDNNSTQGRLLYIDDVLGDLHSRVNWATLQASLHNPLDARH